MRKVVLLVALLACGAVAAATVAAGSSAAGTPKTIHVLDVAGPDVPVGNASSHQNPQPGDEVLRHDSLYAWNGAKRGSKIGHVESTLAFRSGFSRSGASGYIVGQLFLPSGTVMVEGFVHLGAGPSAFNLAVIGGTGGYAGARGELLIRDLAANGEKSDLTLRLL